MFTVMYFMVISIYFQVSHSMRFSGSKGLRVLASEISNNNDFKNTEFKRLLKPLLRPRMPDTDNNTLVQTVRNPVAGC